MLNKYLSESVHPDKEKNQIMQHSVSSTSALVSQSYWNKNQTPFHREYNLGFSWDWLLKFLLPLLDVLHSS